MELFGRSRAVGESWHHPACLSQEELLKQCTEARGRTSGPGGQHRNKVETLVVLTHAPTGLSGQAGERRSQGENRLVALRRLRLALATEVRTGVPIGVIGSDLWRSRVKSGKITCNPKHGDFPALLAEALDVVFAASCDVPTAALRLEVTSSQLIKLVKDHPPALAKLNQERARYGLHALK